MDEVTTRTVARPATQPVALGALLEAWLAVQRGDFRRGAPPASSRVGEVSKSQGWRRSPGEVPVLVAGCAGSVGASTVALLLAGAAKTGRVVECAPAASSGLAGASNAELGEAGNGWVAGRRGDILIQRRLDQPSGPGTVPVPLAGDPGRVTVVDSWWEPRQLLTGSGWLADLARSCPRVVLVARGSVPGVARLEACVSLFGAERCWSVVVGLSRRWPKPVEHSLGALTRQVRAGGRLFTLPDDAGLAVSGVTTEPLPRPFEATADQLLKGLLP